MTPRPRSFPRMALAIALLAAPSAAAQDWPSFRGPQAAGVADTAQLPLTWDVAAGRNVAWTTAVPGLGHSSPVVWGERIFLTSAVPVKATGAAAADAETAVDIKDYKVVAAQTPLAWRLYCLDRRTGRILWDRTAHEGLPRVKRHAKASQASATAATDGKHVVAMMGSEGLFTYDMDGKLLWKHDLGRLDVGYAEDKAEEWSPASSPIVYDGLVIVQNDRHADSYVVAFDVATGSERWRVGRDEMPSWSTPVVHPGPRPTLVTNSPRFIRGHDPKSGRELWRVPDDAPVKVPAPIVAGDLVIVTGGYPTAGRPIYAIRATTGEVVWKLDRGSTYTPTPIVYRDILYVGVDTGILSAYEVATGKRLYQERITKDPIGLSASPVAANGRLYFPSEDGILFVVRAGKTFELLAKNDMKEMLLATPAVSGDLLLVRTRTHLHALREAKASAAR
jgi:outer membrane protein assembly factor BamB